VTQRREGDGFRAWANGAEDAQSGDSAWVRLALATIDEAVVVTDAHGAVRFLNAAAERLCGQGLAEADGVSFERVLALVDERTRDPITCASLRGPAGELQSRTAVRSRRSRARRA